jgi:hypothetical protein
VDGVAPDRDRLEPEGEGSQPEPMAGQHPGRHDALLEAGGAEHPPDPRADDPDDLDDLAGGDDPGDGADEGSVPPAGRMEAWRKRSATGAVLTGIAFGLQQVFQKEREEPAIIMTTSGDPPRDLPVEAEVEHGRPRRSVVNIRPWLLDRSPTGQAGEDRAGTGDDPAGETVTDAPAPAPAPDRTGRTGRTDGRQGSDRLPDQPGGATPPRGD